MFDCSMGMDVMWVFVVGWVGGVSGGRVCEGESRFAAEASQVPHTIWSVIVSHILYLIFPYYRQSLTSSDFDYKFQSLVENRERKTII